MGQARLEGMLASRAGLWGVAVAAAFSLMESSILRVYYADAAGSFDDARVRRLESLDLVSPVGLLAVDLDRDGDGDLASVGAWSRNLLVYFGGR